MPGIFAFAESRDGELRKVAPEVVSAARQLADAMGTEVHAVILGGSGSGAAAAELGRYGADAVFVGESDAFGKYSAEGFTAVLAKFIQEHGCDAALFVGMHAMAGTQDGNMNHTVSGRDYQRLWFNGVEVGETGINAALCGTWGCPVLLVTGDGTLGDVLTDAFAWLVEKMSPNADQRTALDARRHGRLPGTHEHGRRQQHDDRRAERSADLGGTWGPISSALGAIEQEVVEA